MAGFLNMIKRNSKQNAVYWGTPVNDGFGGRTFATPIQILCRWDDREQVLTIEDGEKIISRATVWALQDLDANGLLYNGTLASLTTEQKADPLSIEGICLVKRVERYASLIDVSDIVYKAFLTPWLT